jgi:hypothetical protein
LILLSTAVLTLGVGLNMAVAVDPPKTDAPDAKAILAKVAETYKLMPSYRSHGTMTTELEMAGQAVTEKGEFTMVLEKPDRYRVTWTKSNSLTPTAKQSGAVWHDGTDRNLYVDLGSKKGCVKQKDDQAALGSAMGLSSAVATSIPSLFFEKLERQSSSATAIKDPKLEDAEKVDGVECYVVSGASRESKKETVWIAKDSHLIVKYSRSLEQPEGKIELTDEEAERMLKQMGQEATDENKAKVREMANRMRDAMRQMNVKGTLTETHADVASPKLKKEDFKYELPEGTEFKESLKDVMPGGGVF